MVRGELAEEARLVLQENTEVKPIRKRITEFGSLMIYSDGSRLYEFNGNKPLVVFLTPDGVEKMKTISRDIIKRIHKTGSLGRGRLIDRGRSTVKEHGNIGIIQKTSNEANNMWERNRRLLEIIGMNDLGDEIERINKEEKLRLEVPTYFGFASWKTPTGKHRQALFMEMINDPTLISIDFEKSEEINSDLGQVFEQARKAGIRFKDIAASNIFVRENNGERSYIIIDQA